MPENTTVKRSPGRPRKAPAVPEVKRGPGRPRKHPVPDPTAPKRGPGRPPGAKTVNRKVTPRKSPTARTVVTSVPDPEIPVVLETLTPLEFLERQMNNPTLPINTRTRCAIAAARYRHTATHDGGKKEERQRQADDAATASEFAPMSKPRLVSSNG